jgi:thioredoxin reductase (NADPH)
MTGTKETSVAVVGAGPCGVAASIQLQRSGIKTLLFEEDRVGGLLHNAHRVENYPGIPKGISGPGLCRLLEQHLDRVGVRPLIDEVTQILREENRFALTTASGQRIRTRAVVLGTGTCPRTNLFDNEKELAGRLIFHEVKDAIDRARGKRAAILGGSDAAYDYALNLAQRGYQVTILQRSEARCLPLLAERVARNPAVSILQGVRMTSCREKDQALEIILARSSEEMVYDADFLILACGRTPRDSLLHELKGAWPEREGEIGSTGNLPPGLFLGGDLVRGDFRQAGISVGDGLAAAMAAARYVSTQTRGESADQDS